VRGGEGGGGEGGGEGSGGAGGGKAGGGEGGGDAAAARIATTFSSVPERKREGGRVPVMEVRLILSFSISELAEKRASGSVPETAVLSTLISSRLVRIPSCGGMVPIRPAMLLHAILRISFPLHVTNAFSQHGTLASSHDRPAAFFQLCPPIAS